jgi:uncharacterized coiled-coil protein SlyX
MENNLDEQLNKTIALLEETIAKQEKELNDLSFDIKVKKAKLKKLKSAQESK